MTLERHRSTLIPEVEFSGDGQILVTNPAGFTLPRDKNGSWRRGREDKEPTVTFENRGQTEGDTSVGSFKKNDSNDRNNNRHVYKKRGSVISVEPGHSGSGNTVSTASSSLMRRLRQSKYAQSAEANEKWLSSDQAFNIDLVGKAKSTKKRKQNKTLKVGDNSSPQLSYTKRFGPDDVNSLKGRFSRGKPQITPEIAASLELEKRTSGSPISSISSRSGGDSERSQNLATLYKRFSKNGHLNLIDHPQRKRRFTEERLPFVVFLIVGPLLIVVGIIRLIISVWHEFGDGIWAGVPVFLLGVIGSLHGRNYTHKLKNTLYISFGVISSAAVMVASGFTLSVLVPMLYQVILSRDSTLDARVLANVLFSNNQNHTLPYLDIKNQVTLTLVLDFITMALLVVGFFSQTATVIAIDNYWGTNFDLTGDCDHYGNPRFFNPLEQMSIGQAALFVGLVETTMIDSIPPDFSVTQSKTYGWTMVWDGVLVILAGFVSTCYGKRVDLTFLGVCAMASEFIALVACTLACIFTTMAMSSVAMAKSNGSANNVQLVSLIVVEAIYDLVLVANIIFIVGIVFRQSQLLCSCCSSEGSANNQRQNMQRFGRAVTDYSL